MRKIKITSLNVQGIHQNRIFTTDTKQRCDILCIQEHWLNEYEKQDLALIFPGKIIRCKCVKEDQNHARRTSGQGGVAIIIDESLGPYLDPESRDGNERILVTTFKTGKTPICIINCYLPSGTSSTANETFTEDIDAIHVIIQKYGSSHHILLIGDLNMDHYHRQGVKEKRFAKFMVENNLVDLGTESKEIPTYVNPHLGHKSRIDHAFANRLSTILSWTPTSIDTGEESECMNTSYHRPLSVTATLTEGLIGKRVLATSAQVIYPRSKLNKLEFSAEIERKLLSLNWSSMDTDTAVESLIQNITSAYTNCTPAKKLHNRIGKDKAWFPELSHAVKLSKEKHFLWKEAGKPRDKNPVWLEKKAAKKRVRSIQRKHQAEDRKNLLQEISQATENDPNLAYKLIKRQKKEDGTTTSLKIRGEMITDNQEITSEWAAYFEDLTSSEVNLKEEFQLDLMRGVNKSPPDRQFTRAILDQAIKLMKPNKAADENGHFAELLKLFSNSSRTILLNLCNKILTDGVIPESLKQAYKIVIPKPGKDPQVMDNYRGITIAGLLMKLLETLWALDDNDSIINSNISYLQCGFTKNRSPSYATLMITEAIADAKENKTPLYLISLDARKAFDVVDHFLLKKKLYQSGIEHQMWTLVDNMYINTKEKVRWNSLDSRTFHIQRGVKQGSVISPLLYKLYINDLLMKLQTSRLGFEIGNIYVGAPTCADDVMLITKNFRQVQPLLDTAQNYSQVHKYQLHPQKSTVTKIVMAREDTSPEIEWHLGEKVVSPTEDVTHLGINWKSGKTSPDVTENVKKARRTSYLLLRIGLHGVNGIDPPAALKIIQTYVTPRLIHGLDACVPSAKDIQILEGYYKKLLRQIQALPDNTASEAIYLMLGATTIESQIHCKALSLFGSISRLPKSHALHTLAQRQLATQYENKYSWFNYVCKLGQKYNLDILSAFNIPEEKTSWKRRYKNAVLTSVRAELLYDAACRSTLKWGIWSWATIDENKAHPLWKCCEGKSFRIEMASTRARMLVGRFKTMDVTALYTGNDKDACTRCPLCKSEKEDIKHLLVQCQALHEFRQPLVVTLQEIYDEDGIPPPMHPEEICSAILNGWGYKELQKSRISSSSSLSFSPGFSTGFSSDFNSGFSPNCQRSTILTQSHKHLDYFILKAQNAINRANNVANIICYNLARQRDFLLF